MEKKQKNRPGAFKNPEEGVSFRCPSCGGKLVYDIEKRMMCCRSCASICSVSDIPDPTGKAGEQAEEMETVEYRCPSCGGILHATATESVSFCSYCGSDVVLQSRISHMLRPAYIVPFTVTREECEKAYRKYLRKSIYIPKEQLSQETVGHFRPIYIPFWKYTGTGSETVKEKQKVRNHHSEAYDLIEEYELRVKKSMTISGGYYDACSQFDDETAQKLNFNTDRLTAFHPAYLAGTFAEVPDVSAEICCQLIRDHVEVMGAEEGRLITFPKEFREETVLVLLPVWMLASRQEERMVYTAIDGSDARHIACDLPVSRKKTAGFSLFLTAVLTALLLLLNHYIILRPKMTAALSCGMGFLCWNVIGPFVNRIHQKVDQDDDLTRLLMREGGFFPRIRELIAKKEQPTLISEKFLSIMGGIALFIGFILYVGQRNKALYLDSLISDRSFLPFLLSFAVLIFYCAVVWTQVKGDRWDRAALLLQTVSCFAIMVAVLPFFPLSSVPLLYYGMSIFSLCVTAAAAFRAFMRHNAYVSRPVPFFGKETGK